MAKKWTMNQKEQQTRLKQLVIPFVGEQAGGMSWTGAYNVSLLLSRYRKISRKENPGINKN